MVHISVHNRQSRPDFFLPTLADFFFFLKIFFYFEIGGFFGNNWDFFVEKLGIFRKVLEIFGKFAVADLMADFFFFWADFGG